MIEALEKLIAIGKRNDCERQIKYWIQKYVQTHTAQKRISEKELKYHKYSKNILELHECDLAQDISQALPKELSWKYLNADHRELDAPGEDTVSCELTLKVFTLKVNKK